MISFKKQKNKNMFVKRLSTDWSKLRVYSIGKNLALLIFIVTTSILVSKWPHKLGLSEFTLVDHNGNHFHNAKKCPFLVVAILGLCTIWIQLILIIIWWLYCKFKLCFEKTRQMSNLYQNLKCRQISKNVDFFWYWFFVFKI